MTIHTHCHKSSMRETSLGGGCSLISFSLGATEEGTVGGDLSDGDIIVVTPHWIVPCVWGVSVQDIKRGFKEN